MFILTEPMITRIRKWGNSLGVRLPKAAAQETGLREGAEVDVRARGGEVVVRPLRPVRYRLSDLLDEIHAGNLHGGAWSGRARGREVW